MVSKIDSIERAWDDHRTASKGMYYIGIDPGWEYGIGILNKQGKVIGCGGNKCSSWDELIKSMFEDIDDIMVLIAQHPFKVFIGVEGTHHFGKATNMDVSSIDYKIGAWIFALKQYENTTIISLSPLTRKMTTKEFKSNFALNCQEPTSQHQIDACCLANRLYKSLRSPVRPKDPVKTRHPKIKGKRLVLK